MGHNDSLHCLQVGHLGEGLRQLDHCAHVLATVGQVVAGKAATRVHAAAINQENGGYPAVSWEGSVHMRCNCKHALHFAQVGHLGEGLRQLNAALDSQPVGSNAVQRGEQV